VSDWGFSWKLEAGYEIFVTRSRKQTVYAVISSETHTHPFNGPLSGTTQVSRYSVFYRLDALPFAKPTASKH